MRVWLRVALVALVSACTFGGCSAPETSAARDFLQEGDLLFQSLPHGPLVEAIEGCTHSPYSHCGIARKTARGWVVLEAIGPVKETPLATWIAQARDDRFSVYRLREPYRVHIPAMIAAAERYKGQPYDMRYELDDEKIYCSELIFKAYRTASGRELGRLQTLGELDWKPFAKTIEVLENGPPPLERQMITPRSLSEANELSLVARDVR